ncbi:MAG: calcineurin-like phosphoesterase family protein [Micrococcus sp.]|nr:calcineurin-like phosphoesterase family protein [Micrococcus sp.]
MAVQRTTSRRAGRVQLSAGTLAIIAAATLGAGSAGAAPADQAGQSATAQSWEDSAFRGQVEVVRDDRTDRETVSGTVFEDKDRDSTQDAGEPGVPGVEVSNGREVVTTDGQGNYELPVEDNMTVFVTQPRGYQVPVDEDNVAQFSYNHLPEGSPELKYGGIDPTGAVPAALNFPLAKSKLTQDPEQHCVIGGDIQTYTEEQVEYARAGVFADLAERTDYTGCGALFIGDVVGDDLSLYPKTRELASMLNGPARFLPGNHDMDFDATERQHSTDTFRANLGPSYYSYDAGKAHVVALSTVDFPMKENARPGDYNGSIDERQMEWLRNDIANTPENKVIVLAGHIPLLDFADESSKKHQIDQVKEIYEILEGREVITLGGHTHSLENLRAGDSMKGWKDLFGVDELPFTHITAGAISGDWYNGRMLEGGYPEAVQRDGAMPGVLTLDIKNTEVTERFTVRGDDGSDQMSLSVNTPRYREWFEQYQDDRGEAPAFENPLQVSQADLADTTWLTTNFWMGSTGSTVEVSIDGGEATAATRTQTLQGEASLVGAEYSDPAAVQQQLVHGGSLADRSMHLWQLELPADLEVGEHTAEVTATDVHGREFTEEITFEVTE